MTPLKTLRKAAGLTQGDLAGAVGVTQPAVSAWERGTPIPDPLIAQVAAALGSDLAALRPEAEQPDQRRRRRQRSQRPDPGVRFVQVVTPYRTKAGVTVQDLARRSGVPEQVIRNIEAGLVPVDEDDAAALAPVLGCQPDHLRSGDPGPQVSGGRLGEVFDMCGRPIRGQAVTEQARQEALWQLGLRETAPAPVASKPKAKPNQVRFPDAAEAGRYRRAAGLTQAELADRAGISQPAVSAMENGQAPLQRSVWTALATAVGVHPAKLGAGEWVVAI